MMNYECNKDKMLVVFLLLLFWTGYIFAGITGKITGIVKDKNTGKPLMGANIIVMGTTLGAASDEDGIFIILGIPPGIHEVKSMYIGYQTMVLSNVKVNVDMTTELIFELSPQAIRGEEVVVVSYKSKMIQPDRTSTKQVYLTEEIENIEGVRNVQDVINLQADVVDNHYRGGRVGETSYYINGASIVNPLSNMASFQPMVAALQQVEVITSGFSAEYGNAQSGVVNMVLKEGGDVWKTSFTVESDLPHYKHWGESVYSPEVRQYDQLLSVEDTWYESPSKYGVNETQPLYQGTASKFLANQFAFKGRNAKKELAFLAMNEYLLASNEIGRDYKNVVDRRYDLIVEGPISDKVRLFVAGQLMQTNNTVPYYIPDGNFQILGNLTYRPKEKDLISLQYLQSKGFNFGNFNIRRPYYSYDIRNVEANTLQTSLRWQHIFSPASFLNVSAGYFNAGTNTRSPLTAKGEPQGDYFLSKYTIITGQGFPYVTGRYGVKESETYNFNADFTSQVNFYNLIKTGIQFNYTHIFSDFVSSVNGSSLNPESISPKDQVFDHYPYEGAIYIQDKIEYKGMILNAGLRWDFYNFNTEAFTDVVSPTRNPNFISLKETPDEKYYDEKKASKEKTKIVGRLSPRLGVSFPISEAAVFHVNYGKFFQQPSLTKVFQKNRIVAGESVIYGFLGNPNIKPEVTSAYDIGVVFALPLGFALDMSTYQKAVKNLLAAGRYIDDQKKDYDTQINRDYANIEGFHINLERTGKHVDFFARYNWQQATGKSEGYGDDRTIFIETTKYGPLKTSSTVQPEDEFMDYDRTHRLVANLRLKTGNNNSPFLNNITLSSTYRFMTGRPYTYDPQGLSLIKNKRTREDHNLSMRLSKSILFSGLSFLLYLDVFNVLDFKQLSFGYLNGNVRNTEKYFSHSPYYSRQDFGLGDFWYDNFISAYSNQPRHYCLGIKVDL